MASDLIQQMTPERLTDVLRRAGQLHGGPVVEVWWSHLERVMLAVEDLGCRELLD